MMCVKKQITVAILMIATVICFSQEVSYNWKIDFDLAAQNHDDRIVLVRHWATGVGVYQLNLLGSKVFHSSPNFLIYGGVGLSIEHMTTNAAFNGLLIQGFSNDFEFIDRYTKAIFLFNAEIEYKIFAKSSFHLQFLPHIGLFRKIKNTRELSNSISYFEGDIFYNDAEFNIFFSRAFKMYQIKIGYRVAHLKSDKALFFDKKPGNENIPQEQWVHNSTFDLVNPLKLFFGVSRKF